MTYTDEVRGRKETRIIKVTGVDDRDKEFTEIFTTDQFYLSMVLGPEGGFRDKMFEIMNKHRCNRTRYEILEVNPHP